MQALGAHRRTVCRWESALKSVLRDCIGQEGSAMAFVANEALKDQVKIKAANGDAYIDVFAEESIDFDASNTDNYCCFADITEWASNNPVNARYTVANVVADQDDSSWGGWVLILVYADAAEPMRNLTVFDGLAMITVRLGRRRRQQHRRRTHFWIPDPTLWTG